MSKRKHKEKRQFQLRISIVGICCTVLAVIISAIAMYKGAEQSMNRISEQFLQKLVHQVSMNVDENIARFSSIFISIELDPEFTDVLDSADEKHASLKIKDINALQQNLLTTQLLNEDIKGIYVFDKYGDAYYSMSSPSLRRNYHIEDEEWFSNLKDTHGLYILGTHVPNRYLLDRTEVVSLIQRVENLSNNELYGTIILDIDARLFDKIIATLDPSSDSAIVIVDDSGNIIYENISTSTMKSDYQMIMDRALKNEALWSNREGSFDINENGISVNFNFTTSQETGWKTICLANLSEISQLKKNIIGKICVVIILAILFTGAAILFITDKEFNTLYTLKNAMKEVRNGNYDVKIDVKGTDEIANLCGTFNEMVDRINYYINTVERLEHEKQAVQLKKVQAELDTLQAQINPHFIYNTLETISMMAEINDDEQTEQMASALGKLMRVSIKGDRIVTLAKELEYLKYYTYIQKTRFGNKFNININIDSSIYDCQIPKLILQPLVENCINHGISSIADRGMVTITGKQENDTVVIEVVDNGVGMSAERLSEIKNTLASVDEDDGTSHDSIGLFNVNQRLKLFFKDNRCGIDISSDKGRGTRIIITCLSIRSRGDMDD